MKAKTENRLLLGRFYDRIWNSWVEIGAEWNTYKRWIGYKIKQKFYEATKDRRDQKLIGRHSLKWKTSFLIAHRGVNKQKSRKQINNWNPLQNYLRNFRKCQSYSKCIKVVCWWFHLHFWNMYILCGSEVMIHYRVSITSLHYLFSSPKCTLRWKIKYKIKRKLDVVSV